MSVHDRIATAEGKRRFVRAIFATIADRYDFITVILSYGQDRRWKRRLVDLAAVRPGARALDLGVAVNPAGLDAHWWTIPVLLLSALRAGLQEEIVVLGYLFARLRDVGWGQGRWGQWQIIVGAALLRGSYHLYQGFGGFVGNVIMGLIFGWLYTRWGRVLPFVIAHVVIDAAIFVGYPWAAATFPTLFGLPA